MWRDRLILLVLVIMLSALQYRLWLGKNSVSDYLAKQQEVEKQRRQNANLVQRNALLKADINDLTIGLEAVEERARNELGLIKRGETFYRILPPEEE
ncbi:cell division protein FtsB [Alteromonas gilva]|uniref:Cell division protein FtsB n=1 Tax=Alteromonas gilva TaxID=2987522 RepID=A0ABT5L8X7_9ALTE|nr:cell division protein FtsB [Alteromonas gilva]MDC8833096.1 cell division protein FtsB [Alteromonas gilva]